MLNSKPETLSAKLLLIRELNNARHQLVGSAIEVSQVEHNRVAWFQRIDDSLEVRQRRDRHAVDAGDDLAHGDLVRSRVSG